MDVCMCVYVCMCMGVYAYIYIHAYGGRPGTSEALGQRIHGSTIDIDAYMAQQ